MSKTYLFILELEYFVVAANDLVTFVLGRFEEFWQSNPANL